MRPYGDRILAKPLDKEEGRFASAEKEDPRTGVAEVVKSNLLDVRPGDTVYHSKYDGNLVSTSDGDFLFLKAEEIVGVE